MARAASSIWFANFEKICLTLFGRRGALAVMIRRSDGLSRSRLVASRPEGSRAPPPASDTPAGRIPAGGVADR